MAALHMFALITDTKTQVRRGRTTARRLASAPQHRFVLAVGTKAWRRLARISRTPELYPGHDHPLICGIIAEALWHIDAVGATVTLSMLGGS